VSTLPSLSFSDSPAPLRGVPASTAEWPAAERATLEAWLAAAWAGQDGADAAEPDLARLAPAQALWAAAGAAGACAPRAAKAFAERARAASPDGFVAEGPLDRMAWRAQQEAFLGMDPTDWGSCAPGEAPAMFEAIWPAVSLRPDWASKMAGTLEAQRLRRDIDGLRFAQWLAGRAGAQSVDLGLSLWHKLPAARAWLQAQAAPFSAASWIHKVAESLNKDQKGRLRRELDEMARHGGLPAWSAELGAEALRNANPEAWEWLCASHAFDGGKITDLVEAVSSKEVRPNRYDDPAGSANKGKTHPPLSKDRVREIEATRAQLAKIGALWDRTAAAGELSPALADAIAERVAVTARGDLAIRWLLARGASPGGVGGGGVLLREALRRGNFPLAEELALGGGWGPAAELYLARKTKARAARSAAQGVAAASPEEKHWARWEAEGLARWEARQMGSAADCAALGRGGKLDAKEKKAAKRV
jgi:hypothetical protein